MRRIAPISIDVDDSVRAKAADIAIAAVREAGADPWKAASVPMIQHLAADWGALRMTREEFIRLVSKLVMLNPSIALKEGTP